VGSSRADSRRRGFLSISRERAKAHTPRAPTELFVPSSFEAQARRVLEQIESGSYEDADGREDDAGRVPV
jgi:hypothetical protein